MLDLTTLIFSVQRLIHLENAQTQKDVEIPLTEVINYLAIVNLTLEILMVMLNQSPLYLCQLETNK